MRPSPFFLVICALVLSAAWEPLRANHFEVTLALSDGQNSQNAKTQTEPPQAREVIVRPEMQSSFGKSFTASWKVTCQNKDTLKDVLIHFYVVRIDKPGQAPPPLEPAEVVIETAQTMDFSNRTSTSAVLQFQPDRPGIYLVRIETQGTAEATGQEYYAAIDLIVK